MTVKIDSETLAAVQLNLTPGLGPRLQTLLLDCFGSAENIFAASGQELLSVQGIGPKVSAAISSRKSFDEAQQEIQKAAESRVSILTRSSSGYPRMLTETCDAPPVLYVSGTLLEKDTLAVAIVGSRHCTHYGREQARKIAGALARAGIVVVSGLARGIDAAAHRGALEAGGRTIAVCAPGLLKMYPPEHKDLAQEIIQQGALISESPLERGPQRGLFPQRNRIIAGLSLGTIIIEAGLRSGSLHTARHSMEQGRDVFAVPGRIDSPTSEGAHNLIRDGAQLIRNANDVIETLGPLVEPVQAAPRKTVHTPRELNLNEQEQLVLNLIDAAPTPIDHVLMKADMPSSRVLSTLTVLEMKRLVRRLPGSSVERIHG